MFRTRVHATSTARFPGNRLHRLRRAAAGLVAAVANGLTASCSSTADGDSVASPKGGKPATPTAGTPDRPVKTPAKPQRVIGLSYASTWMRDAGVSMVGATDIDEGALSAEHRAAVKKTTIVGEGNELNSEKIAPLTPDLIVISAPGHTAFNIGTLKPVAPVLPFPIENPDELLPTSLRVIDARGKAAEGAEFKETYRGGLTRIRSTYAQQLAKTDWAIVNSGEAGKFSVYTEKSWLGVVTQDAGARFDPLPGAPKGEFSYDLSFEEIGKPKDADVILVDGDVPGGAPVAETKWPTARRNWTTPKANQNRQVHPVAGFFVSRYHEGGGIPDRFEQTPKPLP
ncbi:ABC transporter substrate-binding protein [Streptomyces albipurpureus]|uniref:ABC transporter substrate-binding protein n=1 Tax=Streptomyces albipurpureus TaxID=2897419 RepID=A0ABT0UXB2_9ACTN|nr:ABC transporter substrate-binding protein [Streptomyces sp. CWNU-1]MCM2392750.1 ABC transporter substrate-binding protein [Streptomyces sp. CWNU-1]